MTAVTAKQVIFQAHWLLGITAGVVLALMGITGALYAFKDEISLATNSEVVRVQVRSNGMLPLPELIWRIEAAQQSRIEAIRVEMNDGLAGRVFLRAAGVEE